MKVNFYTFLQVLPFYYNFIVIFMLCLVILEYVKNYIFFTEKREVGYIDLEEEKETANILKYILPVYMYVSKVHIPF